MKFSQQIFAAVVAGVITVVILETFLRPRLPELKNAIDTALSTPPVIV